MKIAGGHLTYCTNIHAGEAWEDHFDSLRKNFPLIKEQVSKHSPMGIGLRLSNTASLDLQDSLKLRQLQSWLKDNEAYVFTMNGFPYGDFHHAVVKDQVHAPDWTTAERLDYTSRLFDILKELLPAGQDGGISTSPLSYRFWYQSAEARFAAEDKATRNIIAILTKLYLIGKDEGIHLHLDIEPEPDGLLETGAEFITWYEQVLLPMAELELAKTLGLSPAESLGAARKHICLCYDVCHFAIGYEPHHKVLEELAAREIKVGKIQISAALKANLPEGAEGRELIAESFARFNEPTYLHQVVARTTDKHLLRYRDLPEALQDIDNRDVEEWRAHFHVPVFLEEMGVLRSTQSDIKEILQYHQSSPVSTHLEVETYTWEVLPDSLKAPIDQSISRELNWVKSVLISPGTR